MDYISWVWESRGVKRTLASIFAVAAVSADFIPAVAPFKELLLYLAGACGAAGITNAVIDG